VQNRLSRGIAVAATLILAPSALIAAPTTAYTDAEMEACLSEGEILKGWEPLIGLTKPLKVELDCDGRSQKAVFKSLDVHKRGLYMLANGSREFNFSDCYKYERAAYLLDRELGLGMVPVAVLRSYQGTDGVLVAWIHNVVHENLVSSTLSGPEVASLTRQRSVVRMFDSLIYNVDRRPPNILVDESLTRVYMIDHSQSFRETKELQEEFLEGRVWLSEEVYSRLQALDEKRLDELMGGLLTRGQRKTLLVRRDLIVEKIERDRREFGDEAVFVAARQ
jgi:hypothetical protein